MDSSIGKWIGAQPFLFSCRSPPLMSGIVAGFWKPLDAGRSVLVERIWISLTKIVCAVEDSQGTL
jgi:hypothetical protein